MDEQIEGLAIIPEGWGHLCVVDKENEQNVMTKAQVAAAKAKGWNPRYKFGAFGTPEYVDYEGIDEGTNIEEIKNDQLTIKNDVFDLSGRKIINGTPRRQSRLGSKESKNLPQGIYVKKGKTFSISR